MRYINLTPHEITLYSEDGSTVLERIPPSGGVARVVMTNPAPDENASAAVPLFTPGRFHAVDMGGADLDDLDAVYIVSMFTAQALADDPNGDGSGPWRGRVVYPGTGPGDNAVRDEQGRICGVTRLYRPFPGWWTWPKG